MDTEHPTADYAVPDSELQFRACRASGPGGQHVNTTASRVIVTWDIAASPSLPPELRTRLLERLAHRIDQRGCLQIAASDERSQHRNRALAMARLRALVAAALRVARPRRATKAPPAANERRLEAKRLTAARKHHRRPMEHEG